MKSGTPKSSRAAIRILAGSLCFFLLIFLGVSSSAQTLVPGNPDCCTINTIPGLHDNSPGNNLGLRIEGFGTGSFDLTLPLVPGTYVTLTCNSGAWTGDPDNTITVYSPDGIYLDWSSTVPLDAVIVKGGPDANVYYYEPESYGGQGLHAPLNPNNGTPYGISHIDICLDYEIGIDCPDQVALQCTPADWDPSTNPVFGVPTILYPPVYICNDPVLSWNDVSDGQTCPETITRTWTVMDDCGDMATCTQVIIINDTEAPLLNCPAPLDAVCSISEVPAYTTYSEFVAAGGTAYDNCALDESSFALVSESSDNNSCPEVVTRTYQIADLCGNIGQCTQAITIDDDVDPVITCPGPLTAVCSINEQPVYADYAAFVAAGGSASDNCDLDITTFAWAGDASDGNTCPEVITRTYQIEDLCGNIGQCTQTITIDDDVYPVITCPGPLTAVCDISEQPAYATYAAFVAAGGSASDNCDIDASSFTLISEVSDMNSCPETVTRTYQVADLCGNTATCQQTLTIDDEVSPVLNCPPALNASCSITEHPAYTNYNAFVLAGGSATDNCDIDASSFLLINEVSDGNSCPEIVTRTYQIADLCGNIATCQQTITVDDQTAPVITCPGPLAAVCNISEQPAYADYAAFVAAGGSASDDCGIVEGSFTLLSEISDNNTCPETVTRTYQIEDLCGNIGQCTQIITIDDETDPVITCPGPLTAVCSITEQPVYADYAAFIAAGGSASDNCDLDITTFAWAGDASDGNTCPEVITRTYQIEDLCGNIGQCTQTITIDDDVDPVITCPGPLTAVCDISEQPAYATYAAFVAAGGSASDNCDIDASSFTLISEVSDMNSCPETVTRTYQVADLCGNTATCQQTLTIDDEVPPVLTCPGPLTAACNITEQPAYADLAAFLADGGSATDNCDIDASSFVLINEVSDGNSCPEIVTRTYQIADLCGNITTCQQTITVDDDTDPVITCPGPLAAVCNISEQPAYADYAAFVVAGGIAFDNCGIDMDSFSWISDVSDGNTCPETVTRTYQIEDLCGNIGQCTQIITIDDETDPVITCPGPLTAVCSISEQPVYADYAAFVAAGGSASDNCDLDITTFAWAGDASDGNTCPEVITRTYQIEDLCGNIGQCTQAITIDDDVDPVITCPGPLTAVCSISEHPAYATYAAFVAAGGSASDNCDIDEGSFILADESSDGNTCPEVITRTYQVSDLCGNAATCQQAITIDDEVPPVLTCPPALNASCSISEQPAYIDYDAFVADGGSASDNCTVDESSFLLINEVSDGNSCPEIVTRTYQIADLCGNIATCQQTITVDDQTDPVITCPGPLAADCNISEQPAYADYAAFVAAGGSASDDCGIVEGSFTLLSEISDNNTCPETVTRTYQIEDLCGNIGQCTQIITIDDETDPVITCPGPLTAVCSISEQPVYADYAAFVAAGGSASDNCDLDITTFAWAGDASDGNTCPEVITRTYQIEDLCGNIGQCTQAITIDDDVYPVITCPGPLTAVCNISEQPPYATFDDFVTAGGSASDNCGIHEGSFILADESSDGNTCPEVITRTYQVADLCGNAATCQQTITIDDEVDPVLIYNGLTYIEAYCGDLVYIDVSATDNCTDPVTIICTRVDPPGEVPRDCSDPEFYDGTTTLTYIAVDDCGNESASLTITVFVTSPVPCEIMLPDQLPFCYMLENTAWAGPNTQAGAVSYYWYFPQHCIDDGWMITNGDNTPLVEYTSGSGVGQLYLSFVDTNGCAGVCYVDINCIPAWDICTMTQGYYGNAGGTFCNGQGTYDLLDSMFVANGGSFMVGQPGASLTLGSLDPAQCVINILPGGGPAKALDQDWTCDNLAPPMIHKRTGKLRNILVAQTMTLNLNMWLTPDLGDMPIVTDVLTIAPTTGCGPYSTGNYSVNNFTYYQFPATVLTELESEYGDDPMISHLLDYANRGIGGESLNVSLSDIVAAVTLINEAFDECMTGTFDGGYVPMNQNSLIATDPFAGLHNHPVEGEIEMRAYPNPFSSNAFIEFTVPERDKVFIRVYTLTGVKVADLFEATVEPNTKYTVEFNLAGSLAQEVYVIVLRTSKQVEHGRIIMIR